MAHEARNLGLEQQDMTSAWVYYNIELPNWNTDNMIVGGVEVKSLAPVRHAVMTIEQFCRVAARQFGKSVLEPKMLCKLLQNCVLNGDKVETNILIISNGSTNSK